MSGSSFSEVRNAGLVLDVVGVTVFNLFSPTLNSFPGRTGDFNLVLRLGISGFLNSLSSGSAFAVESLLLPSFDLDLFLHLLTFLLPAGSLLSSVISSRTLTSPPDIPPLFTVNFVVSLSSLLMDNLDLAEAFTLGGVVSNGLLSSFLLVEVVDFNTFCCFLLAEIERLERN